MAFESETPSVKFMKQMTIKYGGLDFAPAIKMARELALRNLKKFQKVQFVLVSNGDPNDKEQTSKIVQEMKVESWISKLQFLIIGYGIIKDLSLFGIANGHSYGFSDDDSEDKKEEPQFAMLEKIAREFPKGLFKTAPMLTDL